MTELVEVVWDCDGCGVTDGTVEVPVRETAMAVTEWLTKVVAPVIENDHDTRSPRCLGERLGIAVPTSQGMPETEHWHGEPKSKLN